MARLACHLSSTSIPTAQRALRAILSASRRGCEESRWANNAVTNYRGLPAVSYREMSDFDLQQEVCAKAGITGRIISNPFAAEVIAAIASKPAIDVVKHVND